MTEADPPRLLVAVAHPDDETFACGSVLLEAKARGAMTTVVCATRGEAGQPRPGSGLAVEDLPAVREAELRQAAALLDVDSVVLLGLRDSGMEGAPAPGTLAGTPVASIALRLAALFEQVRPDVVITLDAADGHRDHAHVRDAVLLAVNAAAVDVERVYLHCLPRSLLRRWADHMRDVAPDSPYLDVDEAGLGTTDDAITTVVDTATHLEQRLAAIAAHRSQVSPFEALPQHLRDEFLTTDHLMRVVPPWTGGRKETALFPG